MLKKVFSILLSAVMLLGTLGVYAAGGDILYQDDFESGTYTVADGTNNGDATKTVKKDGVAQWIFEKKPGTTFAAWSGDLVGQGVGSGDSKILMSGANMGNDTILYYNLPKVYDKGVITIDMKIKRPSYSGGKPTRITTLLYDNMVSNYTSMPNRVLQTIMETNSSSQTRIAYAYAYQDASTYSTVWTSRVSSTTWWTFRYIVNLDNKTIQLLRSSSGGTPTDWATINFATIQDTAPYTMANGVGSIVIRGIMDGDSSNTGGLLNLDNVMFSYQAPESTEIISGLSLADQNGTSIASQQPISLDGVTGLAASATLNCLSSLTSDVTARLIVAAYDDKDNLLAVHSGMNVTSTITSPQNDMTSGNVFDISQITAQIKKIKVFAWDFSSLRPYKVLEQAVQ